jgi:hypothetical protein
LKHKGSKEESGFSLLWYLLVQVLLFDIDASQNKHSGMKVERLQKQCGNMSVLHFVKVDCTAQDQQKKHYFLQKVRSQKQLTICSRIILSNCCKDGHPA